MTRIWKKFIDLSLKEFNRIYDYLNVHFESYRGESAYSKDMKDVIKMLDEKGIIQVAATMQIPIACNIVTRHFVSLFP